MTTTESHTPIAVPCEELEVILDALGQGIDLPGDVVRAIERVRGRFPANWGQADRIEPMLGLATTRQLLEEVCARLAVNARHREACEVARLAFALPDHLLDYLTVDEGGDVAWLSVTS